MTTSPETRCLTLPRPLTLDSGAELPEVTIAYRTWGSPSAAGDNAVLVCHALTGSADVDTWWPALLGPGCALDPDRDFIVCSNVLGGCYGTTGPTSPRPTAGEPWGADFPAVTVRDMVRAQRELLAALGVRRLRLVIGGSLGGMQALEWAVTFPELVGAAAIVAAPGRHSAWATGLSAAQRAAIESDPRFAGGRYPADDPPRDGLATARMIAMCSYRSPASFQGRFARSLDGDGRFAVEGYLRRHGDRLVERFDANTYLTLLATMDAHDVARGRGEYADVLRCIRVPALLVAVSSDVLYPPDEVEGLADLLPHASFALLRSPHGHDAFLIEGDALGALVRRFRSAVRSAPKRRDGGAPALRVLKFGGSSVADAARLRHVAELVADAAREGRAVAVVSALAGVTDTLMRLAASAAAGGGWRDELARLAERHLSCARQLGAGDTAEQALAHVLSEAAAALGAIERSGTASPESTDAVLACGERLALVLATGALAGAGLDPTPWDTRGIVVTDSAFGGAQVDLDATRVRAASAWSALTAEAVPVATGFIAADREGRTTTLGRGGSDFTASLLAASLGATSVEIWTDVDGVLSAPPAAGVSGLTLPRLSYEEATQLARHGGKLLHPDTMAPAAQCGIPIVVRNTFNPGGPCTVVSAASGGEGVLAVSARPAEGLVAVVGGEIDHLTLVAQRTLSQSRIAVLATVATGTPGTIAFKVAPDEAWRAVAVLHQAFVAPGSGGDTRHAAAGGWS